MRYQKYYLLTLIMGIIFCISYFYYLNNKITHLNNVISNNIKIARATIKLTNPKNNEDFNNYATCGIVITNESNGMVFFDGLLIFFEPLEEYRSHWPSFGLPDVEIKKNTPFTITAINCYSGVQKSLTLSIKDDTWFHVKINRNNVDIIVSDKTIGLI